MKNALKNWWKKPWINGTYVKYCVGGSALAFIIMWIVYVIWLVVKAKEEAECGKWMKEPWDVETENSDEVEEP